LKQKHRAYGDTFSIQKIFVKINHKQHYWFPAVDQDSQVVSVFLRPQRDSAAAKRFFNRPPKSHSREPRMILTDRLRSDGVAYRELISATLYCTQRDASNRTALSNQPTRVRKRACVN
jgi:putative transposase